MRAKVILLVLTVAFGLVNFASGQTSQKSAPDPDIRIAPSEVSHHLILGVPFVRWGEAAALNYQHKDTVEPSWAAVASMDLKYWGYDAKLLEGQMATIEAWPNLEKKNASLDDIRKLIDQDIPVIVMPTLTPYAHRLYVTVAIFGSLQGVSFSTAGSSTNLLGKMASLEDLSKVREKNKEIVTNESTDVAARLIIGYDDEHQVFILHDPSFGPSWQVSYSEFDKMWSFFDRSYAAFVPPDSAKILASKKAAEPYPLRSPDNEAAVRYVYGYAEEYIGRTEEAERDFREGLAIPGIGIPYQHLLHFELASAFAHVGKHSEAIAETEKAIELYPKNPVPWLFLSKGLSFTKLGADWKKRSQDAANRARDLCNEKNEREVARALANDFRIVGCKGEYLGWGLR